ncbi:MAG: GAF domain-containing protein [Gammaproteobacteria bacterium]|nr:GAF domain-containing protein [Gammaproteobacteria bacterium]
MNQSEQQIPEKLLLNAITTVLSQYITETDPYILFNGLLDVLLEITESEYGFIGEIFYTDENKPYIKSYATTNIAWSEKTRRLYEETKKKGMIFSKIDSLYGSVIKTGQLVISNNPNTDSRRFGLPEGHPPLNAFMGIPFYGGGKLLGIVGVANRKNGYHKALAESLQPFLMSCGNLIQAYQNNIKHKQVETELNRYKERLLVLDKNTLLGSNYEFNHSLLTLTKNGQTVLLTKKELKLLEILMINCDHPTQYLTIEKHVWENVIVGESSLRSLLRRLRNKLPDLTIKTITGIGYMLVSPDVLSQKNHK